MTDTTVQTYLTVMNEATTLPNSRQLTADPFSDNMEFLDGGSGSGYQLVATGNLKSLAGITSSGILAYNGTSKVFSPRSLTGDASITITNADGSSANPIIAVNNNTTIQQVNVASGGTTVSTRSKLNFINGDYISVSVADNGLNDQTDITISSNAGSIAGTWSEYPATQNVSFGGFNITGASKASIGYASLTASGNFGLNLAQTVSDANACIWMQNSALPSTSASTGGVTLSARNNGLVLTNSAANYYVPVTNDSTISTADILVGTSAGIFSTLPIGAAGYVLTSNGAGVLPSWQDGTSTPSDWAEFPATQNVNFGGFNITGAGKASIGYASLTASGNFGINLAQTVAQENACMWMQNSTLPSTSSSGGGVTLSSNSNTLVATNGTANYYVPLKTTASVAVGNILVGSSTAGYTDLAIGTNNQVLVSNGTTAQWSTVPALPYVVDTRTIAGGSTYQAAPQVMLLVTTTEGDTTNANVQLDIPSAAEGSWIYIQVLGTNSVDVLSGVTTIYTISGNAMHYFMKYNGSWALVY